MANYRKLFWTGLAVAAVLIPAVAPASPAPALGGRQARPYAAIAGVDFDPRWVYVDFQPKVSSKTIQAFEKNYAEVPMAPTSFFYGPHDIRPAYLVRLKDSISPSQVIQK